MERPVFQPVGTPVYDIDTPALVVDLVAMELNIEVMHSYFRQASAKLRPHVASHSGSAFMPTKPSRPPAELAISQGHGPGGHGPQLDSRSRKSLMPTTPSPSKSAG